MRVSLAVLRGNRADGPMEFTEPRGFLIGRAREADYHLPETDPYVSRHHAFLELAPPSCRIRNLSATNPLAVNGLEIDEGPLADGDVVQLGYTRLRISIDPEVTTEVARCAGCGAALDVVRGESPPQRCERCPTPRAEPRDPAPASCMVCGADLTAPAQSDGRATDLAAVASYACDGCVPAAGDCAGRRVGTYELRRYLGQGGMGSVFLAYQRATCRVVALKAIHDLRDRVLVRRFEREMRLHERLMHGNVVRSIDSGIADGSPFLVTEYVAGGSLEAASRAEGALPVDEVVRLAIAVLPGLEYIHREGIVHRDVKPANVLLSRPRAGGGARAVVPKLADFGLAVAHARAGGTRLTGLGAALGTVMFMPPEQIRNAATVGPSADIYALGVTLYFLLTGHYTFDFPRADADAARPRDARAALEALARGGRAAHPLEVVLRGEPTPIRDRDASIPASLAAIVDRAVRKDPQRRFGTAAELRLALENA